MQKINNINIQKLNKKFSNLSSIKLLDYIINKLFINDIALVSSYGAESIILLHLISLINNKLPIIFIDTGKLFGETKSYYNKVNKYLNLTNTKIFKNNIDIIKKSDPKGILWSKNSDKCCHIRKIIPYEKAIKPYTALITGRKKFQGNTRKNLNIFEISNKKIKINPLANWNFNKLKKYIITNNLPRHPLVEDGYLSIGCMPCTNRVKDDNNNRDGRWSGKEKTECGIHLI